MEAMFQLRIDTVTVVKEISQFLLQTNTAKHLTREKREKCISLLMLPPVFFSTASRTEKQSGKEKRTLSICRIEKTDKNANHEFPDKIVFFLGELGGEERVVLPIKAFIGSILKY